jgi:predicted AlkP superfamily pyrophosphatase or phosphodiesterase
VDSFSLRIFLLLAVLTGGCAPGSQRPGVAVADLRVDDDRAHAGPEAWTGGGSGRPVVLISIDGLRPDAIQRAGATTLLRMMAEGAYSLEARTVYPSRTLPAHVSMLTGVEPAVHGVTWNEDRTAELGPVTVATVFDVAEAAGLSTAAFVAKSKMRHLFKHDAPATALAPRGLDLATADRIVDAVANHLRFHAPDLLFIHLGEPDIAGHAFGWMGWVYRWAVRRSDQAVSAILQAADARYGTGNYTVIITSDHGGHQRGHGSAQPVDMLIPWILRDAGVQPGRITEPVRTTDTAATVLWLLGLGGAGEMAGRPIRSAFAAVEVE